MKKLLMLAFPILFTGCLSLNSHQTGRTLGKDNQSMFGNFNHGSIDLKEQIKLDNDKIYLAELGTQFGFKENIDLGFKINLSTHFTVTSKLQYLGNKKSFFASSVGLDIGAAPWGLVMGTNSYSGTFSLYNSIHISDGIALTLTPKYNIMGHTFSILIPEDRTSSFNNIYGYSSGLIVGKTHQFSLEYSQYVNNEQFHFQTKPIFSFAYILNIPK